MSFEIAGINDTDDKVGQAAGLCISQKNIGCDLLVGRIRRQAVSSRKVNKDCLNPIVEREMVLPFVQPLLPDSFRLF